MPLGSGTTTTTYTTSSIKEEIVKHPNEIRLVLATSPGSHLVVGTCSERSPGE